MAAIPLHRLRDRAADSLRLVRALGEYLMTAYRLFTLHCIVCGTCPWKAREGQGTRHTSQSVNWLKRQGFVELDRHARSGYRATEAGKAAHDSDEGLYL